jgi:hypothetical protein
MAAGGVKPVPAALLTLDFALELVEAGGLSGTAAMVSVVAEATALD